MEEILLGATDVFRQRADLLRSVTFAPESVGRGDRAASALRSRPRALRKCQLLRLACRS